VVITIRIFGSRLCYQFNSQSNLWVRSQIKNKDGLGCESMGDIVPVSKNIAQYK
jgi:hypothetical protein